MKYMIQYEMDHVGYTKTYISDSKEKAIVLCVEELQKDYPSSIYNIIDVYSDEVEVEDEVEKDEAEGDVEKKKKKIRFWEKRKG